MSVRQGFYAGWRGLEYEASPDGPRIRLYAGTPAEGFAEVLPGRYVRVVPESELDHLTYVTTVCTWRGEPFLVLGEYEDWLRVEYTGGRTAVAERLGLDRFDRGVYQAWAPRGEVTDLHEQHHDSTKGSMRRSGGRRGWRRPGRCRRRTGGGRR